MQLQKYNRPFLFYSAAVVIPWICWFAWGWLSHSPLYEKQSMVVLGSVLGVIGLSTPFAIAMVLIFPDKDMRSELFSQFFSFKGIRPAFWALTLILFPASILLAQAISLPFGYSVEQFKIVEKMSFTAGIFPAWFLLILAPILEEFGWHTYGIHCLRNRFNLLQTSIIFGVIWGIWHMPLSFVNGAYQNVVVEMGIIHSINFLLSLIPYLIIANWLYYKTKRNMLLVILFHFEAGFFNEIFQTHPDCKVIQTALLLIFSAIIIYKDKAFFFSKSHEIE